MDKITRPLYIETHLRPRNRYKLKVRGWKNIFHAYRNHKKVEVAILISPKIKFKIKTITRDNGHYNDQGIKPIRRYSHYKYICTQNRSTSVHKTNT